MFIAGICGKAHFIFLNLKPKPSSFIRTISPKISAVLPFFRGKFNFSNCPTSNFSSVAIKIPEALMFLVVPEDSPLLVLICMVREKGFLGCFLDSFVFVAKLKSKFCWLDSETSWIPYPYLARDRFNSFRHITSPLKYLITRDVRENGELCMPMYIGVPFSKTPSDSK